MRLNQTGVRTPVWTAVEEAVARGLSAHLFMRSDAPVTVAVSGGGDSVALLLAAASWAGRYGRRLVCLTIDHGLSQASAAWTRECAARARGFGLEHRALVWTGEKPTTGVAAAARAARHRLLADATRDVGAAVMLMGHTADDRLEARIMREEGSTVGEPRAWSPSPAWPEGRGVFILRPLIGVRRDSIRCGLAELGETWIDDPANTRADSLRARVRARIAGRGDPGPVHAPSPAETLLAAATVGWAGDIAVPLEALTSAAPAQRNRFLGAALLSAAGGSSPPRTEALVRLYGRCSDGRPTTATLAGARIEAEGSTVRIMRDDGAMRDLVTARRDGVAVFDGRFELRIPSVGCVLTALGGHRSKLDGEARGRLRTVPPAARRALPVVIADEGRACCPLLSPNQRWGGRSLVPERLKAALGVVTSESMIRRNGEMVPGVLDRSGSIERSVHEPA